MHTAPFLIYTDYYNNGINLFNINILFNLYCNIINYIHKYIVYNIYVMNKYLYANIYNMWNKCKCMCIQINLHISPPIAGIFFDFSYYPLDGATSHASKPASQPVTVDHLSP